MRYGSSNRQMLKALFYYNAFFLESESAAMATNLHDKMVGHNRERTE